MSQSSCKRILLAGQEGCRVAYCEDCRVAEIEVGALSLRLEMQAFTNLSEILKEASAKLAAYQAAQSAYERESGVRHVH
jgi:hypothetical protein